MQTSSITFIVAFVIVLALIGLVAYLVRRFGGTRLGANANRGRMPRLAVIDAAAVDNRRRLVLVRRDNVEHLLMIGGPTDIVVEPNIVRASPARGEQMAPRGAGPGDLPRSAPLPDAAGWSDAETRADAFEPIDPEPAPRPNRPTFVDEIRRPAGPSLGERREPSPNLSPSLSPGPSMPSPSVPSPSVPGPSQAPLMPSPMIRPEPAIDTTASRSEPMMPRPTRSEPAMPRPSRMPEPPPRTPPSRTVAPSSAPTVPSNAEQNLAEMAQRLEAALRRPTDGKTSPPASPDQPRTSFRNESGLTSPATPSPKTGFENLEDEMASLLGRPKTPS